MKSVLHFFGNVSSLECRRPVICDTNLEGVKLENLQEIFIEYANETNGCMEVLTSGLIEAITFPLALVSLEVLQVCIDHYNVRSKSIVSKDGNTILSFSRETIAFVLCLLESTFIAFSPIQSLAEYQETPSKFCNTLARKWTKTNYSGGTRLPKVVTKDHLKPIFMN